jgi:hypothetical protein
MRPATDTPSASYDVIVVGGGTHDALARGGASAASPADRTHLNRALGEADDSLAAARKERP